MCSRWSSPAATVPVAPRVQARLQRCTSITTGVDGVLPRCKPFKYTYEKEIVMYAHFKQLDYFSTECTYSPEAYRGFARGYLKTLESIRLVPPHPPCHERSAPLAWW